MWATINRWMSNDNGTGRMARDAWQLTFALEHDPVKVVGKLGGDVRLATCRKPNHDWSMAAKVSE